MSVDILDAVAGYAPTRSVEWPPARQEAVLTAIVGTDDGAEQSTEIPLRYRPRPTPRRGRRASLGATVAAFTAVAGAIVAVALSGGGAPPTPAAATGTPFDPPPGLSGRALPDGKYATQVLDDIVLGSNGRPGPGARVADTVTTYVAADGRQFVFRDSQPRCRVHGPKGHPDFATPSRAFFAGLPTAVDALSASLRGYVEGSSSREEAVFRLVGDALRTTGDLASPKLRAALLAVLSRTPGVTVHEGVRDFLGRPAIRADLVDPAIRPGEVQSLYFDPTNFRMLGERDGDSGAPTAAIAPSPADSLPAPAGGEDPGHLMGKAYVRVIEQRRIVGKLPAHLACG